MYIYICLMKFKIIILIGNFKIVNNGGKQVFSGNRIYLTEFATFYTLNTMVT